MNNYFSRLYLVLLFALSCSWAKGANGIDSELEYNTICDTARLAVSDIVDENVIPNNQVWYTANKKVEPRVKSAFGATYLTNEWDESTGKGVITCDGAVVGVGRVRPFHVVAAIGC